jgi:hypothetical protein
MIFGRDTPALPSIAANTCLTCGEFDNNIAPKLTKWPQMPPVERELWQNMWATSLPQDIALIEPVFPAAAQQLRAALQSRAAKQSAGATSGIPCSISIGTSTGAEGYLLRHRCACGSITAVGTGLADSTSDSPSPRRQARLLSHFRAPCRVGAEHDGADL